jgi:hypothetical protein
VRRSGYKPEDVRAACAFSLSIGTSAIRTAASNTVAHPRVAARLLDKYACNVLKVIGLPFYTCPRVMTACVTAGSIEEIGTSFSTQGSPPK